MAPQTVKADIEKSRSYSDKAHYTQAADVLQNALHSVTGIDRIEVAAEYVRVLRAQGYFGKALEFLVEEDEKLSGWFDVAAPTKWPIIRMKMEICLLKMVVTSEFGQSLEDAEGLRIKADDFASIMELDPSTIDAAVNHAKIRLLSCQYHDPVKPDPLGGLISWLVPAFEKLIPMGRHREAYKILDTYGFFFRKSKELGIAGLDFQSWHTMAKTLISSTDLPFLRADTMILLCKNADKSLDQAMIADMESDATKIYTDAEHLLGPSNVKIQQISRDIEKGPQHITQESLAELKELFSKYEAADAVSAYHEAVEAIIPHIPRELAPDLRLQLYHVSDELEAFSGATLASHLGRIRLISLWIAYSGKSLRAAEAAVGIHAAMGDGGCRWLKAVSAYLASLAFCQLREFQKAVEWAEKCVQEFDGKFQSDISKANTTLMQAKISIRQEEPSSMNLEDFLSFAESAINFDSENEFLDQAALKLEIIVGNINELGDDNIEHWLGMIERVIEDLAKTNSEEADIRRAGLHQMHGSILASALGQDSVPEEWEEPLQHFEEAVTLYMTHKRLVEAANTRQIQSVVLFHQFQFEPELELVSGSLKLIEIALEMFTLLNNLTFISSAAECRSRYLYGGWEYGWVSSEDVLKALESAEAAHVTERADMMVSPSLEAISRRQRFAASSSGLRNIYEHAFSVCFRDERYTQLWTWTQRAKARSLSDQLGLGIKVPLEISAQINQDATKKELSQKAEEIEEQISQSDPMERIRLRGELDIIHSQMKDDPLLKLALDIRNGTPVELDQIRDLGEKMEKRSPTQNVIFVDWVEHSGSYWLLVTDPKSELPILTETTVSVDQAVDWKEEWLDAEPGEPFPLEEDDYYEEEEPEFCLRALDGLITPLMQLTKSEDLLVFCPTGVLHSIPLHALWIEKEVTVMDRNPVIYTASLTTFWQCHRRVKLAADSPASTRMPWTTTGVFEPGVNAFGPGFNALDPGPGVNPVAPGPGINPVAPGPGVNPIDPSPGVNPVAPGPGVNPVAPGPGVNPIDPGVNPIDPGANPLDPGVIALIPGVNAFDEAEQDKVYSFITWMSQKLKIRRGIGIQVTASFLSTAIQQSSLFHFHGHCIVNRDSVADQALLLANDRLTMREVFEMKLKVPHITLVACDSASQGITAGDEPLGMVTAFLCAGAGSVLGTIWPTASETGRYFSKEFYNALASEVKSSPRGVVDLAHITRKACLALREDPDTRQPYHWAGFVLHGCPYFQGRHLKGY